MPSQMAQWPFLARPRWPGVLTESGLCVEPLSVAPLQPFLPASALDSSRRSRGESGWTREAPGWAIPEAYRGSSGGWSHLDFRKPPVRSTALSAAPSRSLRLFRGSTEIAETRTPFPGDGYPANDGGGCPLGGESIIVESKSPIPSAAAEPGPSPLSPRPSTRSALSRALCRFASSKCRCLMRSASQHTRARSG